jgi:hypoxanthine phosphoribosyltransferase
MGAELVKVATLHIKPWSKFMPDFFARSTDAWVVYPWEVKECMMEVVSNLLSQGERRDSIEKKLIELGFKVEAISKYFSFKDV